MGVKLIFTGAPSAWCSFKGPRVTLGLYTCHYSLVRDKGLGAAAG